MKYINWIRKKISLNCKEELGSENDFFKSDQLDYIYDNKPNKMIEKFIDIDWQTAIK